MSKFYVQYISGIDRQPIAKSINVSIERDGLKVFKQLIRWEDMVSVTTSTSAAGNNFSVGGAIMGDVLAGGVGALVGGMAGGSKFDTFVRIAYKSGGTTNDLVLLPKGTPKVKVKFINALTDQYGKAPEPRRSFREEIREINTKAKADREQIIADRRERYAIKRKDRKEMPKWLQESPLKLFGKLRKK